MASKKQLNEIRSAIMREDYDEAFRKSRFLDERSRRLDSDLVYLACLSLFGLGHIRQAESWTEKFCKAHPRSSRCHYLSAYMNLHLGNSDQALLHYTRILETDPSDTFADSVIERMRIGESGIKRDIETPGSFKKYFPDFRRSPQTQAADFESETKDRFFLLLALLFFAGGAVLSAGYFFFYPEFEKYFSENLEEKLPVAPQRGSVIPGSEFASEKPRFLYDSGDDALRDYSEARRSIQSGLVNRARYLIGKIELSNADFSIKERAALLRDFIPVVEPHDFRDFIAMEEILKEPYIYRGAQIRWKGMIVSAQPVGGKIRLILSKNELKKPPFLTMDVNGSAGAGLKAGEKVIVDGIFQKVHSEEMLEVRMLRIHPDDGGN